MTYVLALALLVALPFQFAVPMFTLGEIPIARLLVALILAGFFINALARRSLHVPSPVFTLALGSFLLLATLSVIWAAQPAQAIPKIIFLLNLLPLVFVWNDLLIRQVGGVAILVRVAVLGATGAALTALAFFLSQFIFGVGSVFHTIVDQILPFFLGREFALLVAEYPSLMVNLGGETVLRATAVFPDPHVAAYYFGLTGFLSLGLLRTTGRAVYLWSAALLFLVDLLTFSRGGTIGLLLGGIVYAALSNPDLLAPIKHRGRVTILVGIVVLVFLSPPVLSRFLSSFSFSDTSSTERIVLWHEAVRNITDHPVLGVGMGNYLATARPLSAAGTPFYAHNLYLDIATEVGLVGLGLFLMLFIWAGVSVFSSRHSSPWAAPLGGALTLYLAHSLFETALFSIHVTILLTLLFAVVLSLDRRSA